MNQPSSSTTSFGDRPLVLQKLVLAYLVIALVYFFISLLGGLQMALQLLNHNPLRGIELLSPGRWRMIHTNVIAYGFIANAFLGLLHWMVPRLTLRPVLSDYLSWFILVAWQIVCLATFFGILLGHAQAVEWGETPVWIDPLAQVGLLLVGANFFPCIFSQNGPMYVSLWYFTAALVWTPLTYFMGNFLPEYFVAGSGGGALTGLFIHDLVGLFVTPIGWGLMYYFVPIVMKKPIWSHGLSLVGFWGLAFFYPLTGIHHYLYTPIPMFLQYGAVISTIAVEFVVVTVIINFFGSMWGRINMLATHMPLRWFFTGMILYGVTCFQCAIHTTLTFQKIIHFSDWVVGHAHLVMLGVFSFWIFGTMTYLFPRLLGKGWYSNTMLEWHYWLVVVGMWVMFFALTLGGVFQGFSWASLEPWENSLLISRLWWSLRLVAGLMIIAGKVIFVLNLIFTWRQPTPIATSADAAAVTA